MSVAEVLEVLEQLMVLRQLELVEEGEELRAAVLDYVRDGDLRVTDVQTVASILVPNEARNP